ncbi:hypothetical protein HDV06_004137 [Boothiomyces sp. JEL0866]|nr:hypothetical protein HDV06_004137 [Boothiomyces sp. JEL0866]
MVLYSLFRNEFKTDILPHFDAVVISPGTIQLIIGPGNPESRHDFGICSNILMESDIPILGVCLGHQGLAAVLGGKVIKADPPMHGRLSSILHDGKGLFKDLPQDLELTAWVDENGKEPNIMGLKHKSKQIWTVQFHPESICTAYGQTIIENFCAIVKESWQKKAALQFSLPDTFNQMTVIPHPLVPKTCPKVSFKAVTKKLSYANAENVFDELYSKLDKSFWLDSAKVEQGLSRYSYMGCSDGPESFTIEYSLVNRVITRTGKVSHTTTLSENETFFEYLAQIVNDTAVTKENVDESLEVPFIGGLVGYIGYEMKAESMKYHPDQEKFLTISATSVPDSSFIFADRVVIFDHYEKMVYLSVLVNTMVSGSFKAQNDWLESTSAVINSIKSDFSSQFTEKHLVKIPEIKLSHEKKHYIDNINKSLENIVEGETYEVCLTTQLKVDIKKPHPHPYQMYKHLRKRNPAPYAAYLSLGNGLHITSSSPERFLRITNNHISMKPIKGTLQRATKINFTGTDKEIEIENQQRCSHLANSEKDQSENLMIVDLIRNDLNQISVPNSVCVPHLMVVESYATVHQLVSTVESVLRPDLNPVDAIMRCFPPGSMTGAPKLRTVQIIETLEKIPRGPYSGAIGFFSVNGESDFSVVIRTAVFKNEGDKTNVSVGAGGAIVALSNPEEEFEEMILKAQSVLPSLNDTFKPHFTI